MSKLAYRPEIDGLRALSVVAVVMYHAKLGFPGGYVGVDVFFVISGYLITGFLLNDLRNEEFSLRTFWYRRIRRIVPAVTVTAIATVALGLYILQPIPLMDLARSSIFQALLISNVFFWRSDRRNGGYFAPEAESRPLLHTWSLAIEEQFYILFPLVLAFIFRKWRHRQTTILAVAALLSLAICIYGTLHHRAASFYFLPTRAWELLVGALLAYKGTLGGWRPRFQNLISAMSLLLLLGCFVIFDEATLFPGPFAILPVLGAVGIVVSCHGANNPVARVLAFRPIVFIGLISYSFYLWHWPLLAFGDYVFVEEGSANRLGIVAVSLLIAIASWKWIEQPFRRQGFFTRRRVFALGAAAPLVMLVFGFSILQFRGFPDRFDARAKLLFEDSWWPDFGTVAREFEFGSNSPKSDRPDFIIWGDSHVLMCREIVEQIAEQSQLHGRAYYRPATIPIPGLWEARLNPDQATQYRDYNAKVLKQILEQRPGLLILVARWSTYCEGINPLEQEEGLPAYARRVTDDPEFEGREVSPAMAAAGMRRKLDELIAQTSDAGIRLVILRQTREVDLRHPASDFYKAQRFPLLTRLPERYRHTLEEHRKQRQAMDGVLRGLESDLVRIVDPADDFFDNAERRVELYDDRSIYRDSNHLTRYGAEKFLAPTFERILSPSSFSAPGVENPPQVR